MLGSRDMTAPLPSCRWVTPFAWRGAAGAAGSSWLGPSGLGSPSRSRTRTRSQEPESPSAPHHHDLSLVLHCALYSDNRGTGCVGCAHGSLVYAGDVPRQMLRHWPGTVYRIGTCSLGARRRRSSFPRHPPLGLPGTYKLQTIRTVYLRCYASISGFYLTSKLPVTRDQRACPTTPN